MTTTPQAALLSARIKELAVQHLGTANFVGMGDFVEALAKLQATQAEPTERVTPDMLLHLQDQIKVLAEITATQAEPVQAGELPDEREAFIHWMTTTYPNAYTREDAEHFWSHKHVSMLAWKAATARAALSARKPAVPLTDDRIGEEWFDIYSLNISNLDKARLFARAIERAHGIGLEVKPS